MATEAKRDPEQVRIPVIDPRAIFSLGTARLTLGLRKNCLPREIRLGRLRAAKRAGRTWILGAWLLEWLEGGEVHVRQANTNGHA